MIVYIVTSERAIREELNGLVDEIRVFSKLDNAKAFAKRKFEDIIKFFGLTKDSVKVDEEDYSEKENSEEEYSIHTNFRFCGTEWDVWVSIQKKEIE